MIKLILILLIGLVFASTGIVFLKKGVAQVGKVKMSGAAEIFRAVKADLTSPKILAAGCYRNKNYAMILARTPAS